MSMDFDAYKRIYTSFNDVRYYDHDHTYYSNSIKIPSVTTVKKAFMEQFDEEYWSVHEALKRMYPGLVLSHARHNVEKDHICVDGQTKHYTAWFNAYRFEVLVVRKEWAENSITKRTRGSQIHKYLEMGAYGKFESEPIAACDSFLTDKSYQIPLRLEGICASKCRRMAGQYDRLVYDPIYDWNELSDFKTDEEISFTNAYGKKMKGPFSYMDHTEGNGYIVQINSYREFLESISIPIGRMAVYNIREAEKIYMEVEIPRIELSIDDMINYYENPRGTFYSTRGSIPTCA